MNRGWFVYIFMFALAIGGLSLILTLGAAAEAPDDVSGDWHVRWETPPPPFAHGKPTLRIAQSGRFFTLRFGDGKPVSFTLDRDWKGSHDGRKLEISLRGDTWTLALSGEFRKLDPPVIDEVHLELTGPSKHAGVARRADAAAIVSSPAQPTAGTAHAR